jgi:SET domain-containing protein
VDSSFAQTLEAANPLAAFSLGTPWLKLARSPIHGLGAFACRNIPAGTCVIEYLGERISKAESLQRCQRGNTFILALDDQFDLDGGVESNPARFLNHSCSPNCEARWLDQGIWIVATRDIRAGEEGTFDYGYDLEDYRDHPCHCGAPDCLGYIVASEFASHLRQQRVWRQQ